MLPDNADPSSTKLTGKHIKRRWCRGPVTEVQCGSIPFSAASETAGGCTLVSHTQQAKRKMCKYEEKISTRCVTGDQSEQTSAGRAENCDKSPKYKINN